MAALVSLKVKIIKTLQFEPTMLVQDALRIIDEKKPQAIEGERANYGLFLEEENERGRWLEPWRQLNFYPLSSGQMLEYKICTMDGAVKTVQKRGDDMEVDEGCALRGAILECNEPQGHQPPMPVTSTPLVQGHRFAGFFVEEQPGKSTGGTQPKIHKPDNAQQAFFGHVSQGLTSVRSARDEMEKSADLPPLGEDPANENYTGIAARDTANALRVLTDAVRGVAATPEDRDAAREVTRASAQLLEEAKKATSSPSDQEKERFEKLLNEVKKEKEEEIRRIGVLLENWKENCDELRNTLQEACADQKIFKDQQNEQRSLYVQEIEELKKALEYSKDEVNRLKNFNDQTVLSNIEREHESKECHRQREAALQDALDNIQLENCQSKISLNKLVKTNTNLESSLAISENKLTEAICKYERLQSDFISLEDENKKTISKILEEKDSLHKALYKIEGDREVEIAQLKKTNEDLQEQSRCLVNELDAAKEKMNELGYGEVRDNEKGKKRKRCEEEETLAAEACGSIEIASALEGVESLGEESLESSNSLDLGAAAKKSSSMAPLLTAAAQVESSFVCDVCKKVMKSKTALVGHVNKAHSRPKCSICNITIATAQGLAIHEKSCRAKREKHLDKEEEKKEKNKNQEQCPQCGKWFKGPRGLQMHLRRAKTCQE